MQRTKVWQNLSQVYHPVLTNHILLVAVKQINFSKSSALKIQKIAPYTKLLLYLSFGNIVSFTIWDNKLPGAGIPRKGFYFMDSYDLCKQQKLKGAQWTALSDSHLGFEPFVSSTELLKCKRICLSIHKCIAYFYIYSIYHSCKSASNIIALHLAKWDIYPVVVAQITKYHCI